MTTRCINSRSLSLSLIALFGSYAEITRVRESILQQQIVNREPLALPEPCGPLVNVSEKLFIPVREHPEVQRACTCRQYRCCFSATGVL